MPMAKLEGLIVDNVKERLFGADRLARILDALVEREEAKDQSLQGRRASLEAEIASRDDRLQRLYRAIEEGIVDLDGDLKQRIQTLKQEREVAQSTHDRMAAQAHSAAVITPARLDAFSTLMRNKLDAADVRARQAYLRSVVARIEVGDDRIRVYSDKTALASAAAASGTAPGPGVRGFVRNWRTRRPPNYLLPCSVRVRPPYSRSAFY
jgi:chromosome segregation ATPase